MNSWLVGLDIARSRGRAHYFVREPIGSGETTARTTSVLPYASYRPTDRTEWWAIGGAGEVTLETDWGDRGRESCDLSLGMGLVGLRLRVSGSGGGPSVALRGDAGLARHTIASGAGVSGGREARAVRLRVGTETRFRRSLRGGSAFEPFVAVSAWTDGGTGATGVMSGGVGPPADDGGEAVPAGGAERMLAAHSEDCEWGAGLTALLQPRPDGEGLSFSLAST